MKLFIILSIAAVAPFVALRDLPLETKCCVSDQTGLCYELVSSLSCYPDPETDCPCPPGDLGLIDDE